jgi:chromosome segregation ATPase
MRRDLESVEEHLETERLESMKLKMAASEEQSKAARLAEVNRRLEAELRDAKTQLSAQRGRSQRQMTLDPNNDASAVIKKNVEITRLTGEIQMLSTDNASMASDLEAVTQELEAAVSVLDQNSAEIDTLRTQTIVHEKKIDALTDERDSYRIKLEDINETQDLRVAALVTDFERIEKECTTTKKTNDELTRSVKQLEARIAIQRKEISTLREKIQSEEMLDMRNEILEKDDTIHILNTKLIAAQRDLELLSIDWDRLDRIAKEHESNIALDAVKSSSNATKKLKEMVDVYKKRHHSDLAKQTDMSEQLAAKETQLIELTARVNRFESGKYGVHESQKEANDLRLKLKIDDREIRRLAQKVTDLESQSSDLAEENLVLREKLGLASSDIDTSNLKVGHAVELERLESLNATLQSEIEKLEEERIQLKKRVRLQAMEVRLTNTARRTGDRAWT